MREFHSQLYANLASLFQGAQALPGDALPPVALQLISWLQV